MLLLKVAYFLYGSYLSFDKIINYKVLAQVP